MGKDAAMYRLVCLDLDHGDHGAVLGDGPLSIPRVSGHGGGGGLFSAPRLGLEGRHGLGHAGGQGELLPQLHIGPTLG